MAQPAKNVLIHSYVATSVTTSVWVLLYTTPKPCAYIEIVDNSTKLLQFGLGETDDDAAMSTLFTNAVSGSVVIPKALPAGSKIWAKAIDANATTGFNAMSLM